MNAKEIAEDIINALEQTPYATIIPENKVVFDLRKAIAAIEPIIERAMAEQAERIKELEGDNESLQKQLHTAIESRIAAENHVPMEDRKLWAKIDRQRSNIKRLLQKINHLEYERQAAIEKAVADAKDAAHADVACAIQDGIEKAMSESQPRDLEAMVEAVKAVLSKQYIAFLDHDNSLKDALAPFADCAECKTLTDLAVEWEAKCTELEAENAKLAEECQAALIEKKGWQAQVWGCHARLDVAGLAKGCNESHRPSLMSRVQSVIFDLVTLIECGPKEKQERDRLRDALKDSDTVASEYERKYRESLIEITRLSSDRQAAIDAATKELREEVEHWRVKAECYGNIVHGCTPTLEEAGYPVDRNKMGGIALSVKALATERDKLREDNKRLEKQEQETQGFIDTMCPGDDDLTPYGKLVAFVAKATLTANDREYAQALRDLEANKWDVSPWDSGWKVEGEWIGATLTLAIQAAVAAIKPEVVTEEQAREAFERLRELNCTGLGQELDEVKTIRRYFEQQRNS